MSSEEGMFLVNIEYSNINITFSISIKELVKILVEHYLKVDESLKNEIISNFKDIRVRRV